LINPDDDAYSAIAAAVGRLIVEQHEIGVTPQVCRELWNVATRPKSSNGLGFEPGFAIKSLKDIFGFFELWEDEPGIFPRWQNLVAELAVRGVQVHDANLAASALYHGATHVLTLNGKDFDRFSRFGLSVISPHDV